MIVLDTNVVSEMMRAAPAPAVLSWMNGQDASRLFLTAVTVAEIRYGLRVLPEGKRRRSLEEGFERILAEEERLGHRPGRPALILYLDTSSLIKLYVEENGSSAGGCDPGQGGSDG